MTSEFQLDREPVYNRRSPFRWIVSHTMRYPLLPIVTIVASIINNIAYSFIQINVGRGFDVITQVGWATSALLVVAIGIGVAAVTQGVTGLARNFANEILAHRVERDARRELYGSLLGKSLTYHGRQRIGDIMARATNDVRALNAMYSPGFLLITDSAFTFIVPVVMIGIMDVRLLLVPLVFLVFLVFSVKDYSDRLGPVSFDQREQYGTLNTTLAEAIEGVEVVKANVGENYEWKKFTGDARAFRDSFVKMGKIQAFYIPMLFFSIAWAAALLHGLLLWRNGELTLGQVISFIGLFSSLRFPTFISLFSFNLVQMGAAGSRRILEVLNAKTELDENQGGASAEIRGEVAFENVSFSYDGSEVLAGVDFRARSGETIAIVGHTGSGKTTLTRLMNRIFDASKGRILIDGVDVKDWHLESLRSQISFIEQDVFLFSRSIRENIAFGCRECSAAAVEEAAKNAQAHDFILSFPQGYDTVIGERGVTLSGGQRQRIAIARAFLTNPPILVLDDSTSAIDSATEDLIQKAMRKISENRTTFLITHRLSQIRWADRILLVHGGRLEDQGTHDELFARNERYRRIFSRIK